MGFESSRIARRRLAALSATNDHVQEALAPSSFPGLFEDSFHVTPMADMRQPTTPPLADAAVPDSVGALARQLDQLAHDIVATPGAGGALLAAYAAQARALTMVIEAARRSAGSPLPHSVILAARDALETPSILEGLALA